MAPAPTRPPPAVALGHRTRTRLMISLLAAYSVLAVAGGLIGWRLLAGQLSEQAHERAAVVAQLARYTVSDTVRQQMEELTGYRIEVRTTPPEREAPGTVLVRDELGRSIVVDYRNQAFRDAQRGVLVSTVAFAVGGLVIFTLIAWWVSGTIARPLEEVATAARRMGEGELTRALTASGNSEVSVLAGELERMRRKLLDLQERIRTAERLSTLGTFTAVIAHEIRNPLTSVRLAVQMAADVGFDDDTAQVIGSELERLDLIVDELLAYSRGITLEREPVALEDAAAGVVGLLARQAAHAGVTVAVSGSARVDADPRRLRQVLLNLVVNAIQAQHGGGRVEIHVRADGYEVVDHGPGVAPAQEATLFEAFATDKPDGTGLGLHIAREICHAHGATLTYRRGEKGACFIVAGLAPAGQHADEHDGAAGA